MEEKMKNSKKIIFSSALTLALSVGTILPENVKADDTNPTSSEQKVDDTVKLDFSFYLGDVNTNLKKGNNVHILMVFLIPYIPVLVGLN